MENTSMSEPIIQGGMGFNISDWLLAKTVSMLGQRGTLSGVAREQAMAEKLRRGDPGGHYKRALEHFPSQEIADQVYNTYYVKEGGDRNKAPATPVWSINPSKMLARLTLCANYASVWLAQEGHNNPITVNYLDKIALPHCIAITGAMLAGVKFITVGAGLPFQIPGLLDAVAQGRPATYRVPVVGKNVTSHTMTFDAREFFGRTLPEMERPGFIPIVSSYTLAYRFAKKMPEGSIQGFVIEENTAGGHNAPPRRTVLNELGEPQPTYGEEDKIDYAKICELGYPFWIGGSYASPKRLKHALELGAKGIQAGGIFAFCEESGMDPEIKALVRERGYNGKPEVRTDMRISPTGFPFKVLILEGTFSEKAVLDAWVRKCKYRQLAYLYERPDGKIGQRCPSEPIQTFLAKGGDIKDTRGRGCVCSGLFTTAGLANEIAVVTSGDDLTFLRKIMASATSSYSAKDAIRYLLS